MRHAFQKFVLFSVGSLAFILTNMSITQMIFICNGFGHAVSLSQPMIGLDVPCCRTYGRIVWLLYATIGYRRQRTKILQYRYHLFLKSTLAAVTYMYFVCISIEWVFTKLGRIDPLDRLNNEFFYGFCVIWK